MALNDDIYIMREAVSRLTQMLAGHGIRVTQRGISAFVQSDSRGKPFLINLPYLPDNATPELVESIQGFLDHEVAHVLFTVFSVMGSLPDETTGNMYNILEDIRIEQAMGKRFAGSAQNLARTGQFFLDKYTRPRYEAAKAAGDTAKMESLLMVPMLRAMGGQQVFREFMDNAEYVAVMEAVRTKLAPLSAAITDIGAGGATSFDAGLLASEVIGKLRPPPPPSPLPSPLFPPIPPPFTPPAPPMPAVASPPPDPGAPVAPSTDDSEDEDSKDSEDSEDEDDGDTLVDPDADDGSDMVAAVDEDDDSGEVPLPPETSGEANDGLMDTSISAGMTWDAIDKEIMSDFADNLTGEICTVVATIASAADYLVYTKDKDVIEPLHVPPGKYTDDMLTGLQSKVEHMVAPMQKDLERAIAARSLSSWTPGQRAGRLHPANLARLSVGDERVFRVKTARPGKDVVVGLLVDCSGSMGGVPIALATMAAYALAATLERIGIGCEVMAHTTGAAVADDETLARELKKLGRSYSRLESLYMPVLKGFNERMTSDVKQRFGWLPHWGGKRNNVDGECVEIAGRRVLARRETGKILMVLSDGQPHAAGEVETLGPHLKRVVDKLTHAGVTVLGIGIASEAVRLYYPKYLILRDINDLPVLVMKQLKALIV